MNYTEYKNRREAYKNVRKEYPDLIWHPIYKPIYKAGASVVLNFDVNTTYEAELPKDGAIILCQNHCNYYDSLVFDKAYKGIDHFCLASDEPRGKIEGISFESKGVIWLNRGDTAEEAQKNKTAAMNAEINLLKQKQIASWCPEGTWNLSDNLLMLPIARGMAKTAIEVSKTVKTYIVPTLLEFDYDYENRKINKADVTICEAIEVTPDMDYIELTDYITELFWTRRWMTLEEQAYNDDFKTIGMSGEGSSKVYKREDLCKEDWDMFIESLKAKYKTDWSREEKAIIRTKEQKEQMQVEEDMLNPEVIKKQPVLQRTKQQRIWGKW